MILMVGTLFLFSETFSLKFSRLTKGIYKAHVSANAGRGRPRKTYMDIPYW